MSLLALLLATRPGAGTGGAEAPPPCQRVHGVVLRPSDRRHRCGEPGAAREDAMLHGENQDRVKPPQSGAEPPLGDERPQKRPDDRATRAACGAQSPGPLAAATEERARPTSSLSRGLARLPTSQYYRCVDWRVRSMTPRVARSASVARSSASTAARARRISWPTNREHEPALARSAVAVLDSPNKNRRRMASLSPNKRSTAAARKVHNPFLFLFRFRIEWPSTSPTAVGRWRHVTPVLGSVSTQPSELATPPSPRDISRDRKPQRVSYFQENFWKCV